MWKDLTPEWQIAFEEAWLAFRNGSYPIGAAIFDAQGNLLVREHNRGAEADSVNRYVAHAEAGALRRLDTSSYNPKTVVLYTTMEPCPMCMGTAVMSNIKHLRYAAKDPYCGCVHWKEEDPYVKGQELDYELEAGEKEFVQFVIQSYFELKGIERGVSDKVLRTFESYNSKAVETAKAFYKDKRLDSYAEGNNDFSVVYDEIENYFIMPSEGLRRIVGDTE
ncbi:MAG: nucleoside deaminase [Clostridiales bacterium]|nr:nucleoside deaminase [Clostridiales bacterium]